MSSESFGVVNDLAPVFRPYIQNVYQDLKLGLCKTKVDFERVSGNSEAGECQIRIVLPYCSKKLKWEIIFDSTAPWFAPDFRFDDDSFLMNIDEQFLEEKVPSLSKWNENDPKALSDVISELINLYKIHQIKKLNEDDSSRAYFEYSALLGDALTSEKDIEVWVGSHVVEFLIRLNVDTSKLPELYSDGVAETARRINVYGAGTAKKKQDFSSGNFDLQNKQRGWPETQVDNEKLTAIVEVDPSETTIEKNPGIDTALLLVRYPNSTNAELILSPILTKSLGNIALPLMHQSGVLMDYVPMVTELLNNKIKDLLNNEKLKRDLLAQLIVKYEGAVLEHDANNAAFLFEMNNYHWILQIDIGVKFPDKPPVLTLRSIYHCTKGKPMYKILSGCPYNNFEGYIEQQVEIFKNECMGLPPSNQQFVTLEN